MINYIISDIHFSKTKNFKSISDPMEEFIEILRNDTETKRAIISGDYFDHAFNTSDPEYKRSIQYLSEICALSDEVLVLYGTQSHDRNNYTPIIPFLPDHVHFFKNVGVFNSNINSDKILMIPEEYPDDFVAYYADYFNVDNNFYDIVIGHGMITGAKLNEYIKVDNVKIGDRTFNPKDLSSIGSQVFFGHVHLRQNLADNVCYVGSMNKVAFGEEQEVKGYLTYDGAAVTFNEIKSVHQYSDVFLSDYKSLVNDNYDFDNHHFRILIDQNTPLEDLAYIKLAGLKSKRADKKTKELSIEADLNKLKYESLQKDMELKDQFIIAFEADSKNNKKVKEKILIEINSNLSALIK